MKTLIIITCNDCPHLKMSNIHGIDDSYRATCNHPNIESVEWAVKCGREAQIPPFCPLPNYENNDF